MLDEITGDELDGRWGLPHRPVVADAGYGDATGLRLGLEFRGMSYVVAVKSTTSACPGTATPQVAPYHGPGRPPVPRYHEAPDN
jgi:SRSO17 transposase